MTIGSVHQFFWSGSRPQPGTVWTTDRGVGYLVQRSVLHVTCALRS